MNAKQTFAPKETPIRKLDSSYAGLAYIYLNAMPPLTHHQSRLEAAKHYSSDMLKDEASSTFGERDPIITATDAMRGLYMGLFAGMLELQAMGLDAHESTKILLNTLNQDLQAGLSVQKNENTTPSAQISAYETLHHDMQKVIEKLQASPLIKGEASPLSKMEQDRATYLVGSMSGVTLGLNNIVRAYKTNEQCHTTGITRKAGQKLLDNLISPQQAQR